MIQGFVRDQKKKLTCKSLIDAEQITRKIKQRKKWVFHYESFINLLLGFKIKGEEKVLFNQLWGIHPSFTFSDQLPSGILKFTNPDHVEYGNVLQPLEVFDFLTQTFSFDNLNTKHKILLKAIEAVYLQLRPAAIDPYKQENQFTKGFHQFMNTQFQANLASEAEIMDMDDDTDYQLNTFKEKLILSLNNKLFSKQALKNSNQNLFADVFSQDYQTILEQGPKSLTGGNHLKQVNNQWERTNLPTKDLLTLMRYIILIFLFMNGFQVKQCISKDGKSIYFYLYLSEKNLEILAEKHKLKKKLNLYFIDLFSLEPVDSRFRPLRLNNRLWKPNQYELSDMFKYLAPQIKRLIEQINYKRIAREVNQNKINPKILQQGEHDIQNDNENLTDLEWMAYYQYLVYINDEISVLRRHYQMESDTAALINRQISPINLYLARNKSLKKNQLDSIKTDRYHSSKISLLEQQMMNLMNEYENVLDKNQVPNSKLVKITKQEKLAFTYYELFKQALKIGNTDQKLLFTLWDRMRLNNVNPKYPYVGLNKYQLYTHKAKQMMCWCKYQINELRTISLFSPIERIKLAHLGLYDIMNIDKLEINGFIESTFCLNDNYELLGICEISDEVKSNTKEFFQQQVQNLAQRLKINYLKPWIIQKELLIEYYGEKIGLYFSFLGHLIKYVVAMSLVQLTIYILSLIASGYYYDYEAELSNISSIINSIIQTVWITVFDLVWQREIKIIQINQGNNIKENQSNRKRNAFKGKIKRSIESDYMNSQVQDVQLNAIKQCLTYFLISLFMLLYSGIVIGLIFLGEKIKQDESLIMFPKFEVIITSIINYLLIFPAEQLFYQFSLSMVQFINPLYVKDFENYLVVKYFALNFISHIGPFVFLNSFSYLLDLYCKETFCLTETRYTFYSFIVMIGIKNLLKFLILNKKLLKVKTVGYSLLNRNIEDFVEKEGNKIRFDVSLEENGLIKEYIELFITNTFIFTFGQLSGFSWFILLILMMIRLQTLKYKLFHFYQRPWPKYESDIGIFQALLLFINQFTIIISSSIESFQYSILTKKDVLIFFIVVMLGNFIIQFIVMHILREPPDKYKILQTRQHYLTKSTIEQFQGKSKHQNKQFQISKEDDLKKYPIYKCWGSEFNSKTEQDHLETISSKSDLMDYHLDMQQINSPSNFSSKLNSPNPLKGKSQPNLRSSQILIVKNNQVQMPLISRRLTAVAVKQYNELQVDTLKLQSLNPYGKLWTNDRLLKRNIIMRRKLILLQNLDQRRNQVLMSNQKRILEHVLYVAQQKFKKQVQNCIQKGNNNDDENELQRILVKKNKFVEKKVCLECRKVVALKLKKAIMFCQFRKQNCKKHSLQLIAEYQLKSQLLEQIVQDREQNNIEQLFRVVDFQTISLIEFYKIFDELLLRSKPDITCSISDEAPNYSIYLIQQNKSEVFKTIAEKFFDTFIFHKLDKFQHMYTMQLFLNELFPIQIFKLIKHIYDEFWIVESQDGQRRLMQFLQLKFSDFLIHQPLIKSKLGVSSIPNKYYIKESNLVDQIDDFLIKGYAIVFYENKSFISLGNVLKKRKKCNLFYTEQELLKFFKANLFLIESGYNGDFQTNYYFVNNSEQYDLYNPKRQLDQINSLITVLLQMATLKEQIDHLQQELSIINYPLLREAIEDLLNQNLTVEKFSNYIDDDNENFQESYSYLLNSDNLVQSDKNIVTLLNYEINIHFRLKQYEQAMESINKLQPILLKSIFPHNDSNLSINTILLVLIEKLNVIIKNENIMDDLANYFLCEYIRFAIQLHTQHNEFLEQSRLVIAILTELLNQIDEIQQQQMQEYVNEISQVQIQTYNSLLDLSQPQEKHKSIKFPHSLLTFKRQLMRFKNQIMALQAIHYFYEGQLLSSCQIIKLVIQNQVQLIQKDKFQKAISDTQEEDDIRMFNFDQMSPQVKSISLEDQIINQYINYKPSYCHQAIIYQYMFLILIQDLGDVAENYDLRLKNFLKIKCSEPFNEKLIFNLKLMEDIDNTFDNQQNCLIGRLSWIYRNKWQENNGIYHDFTYDPHDYEYMAKQVINYSLINPTLKNRKFLTDLLKIANQDLIKIKAIQLLLQMDNYLSLIEIGKINKIEIKINQKILKTSLITQLKALHQQFYIAQNSWFYSIGLKHFRYFYYLSLCFTFSKKHVENLLENPEVTQLAQKALKQLDFQGEYQFYFFKAIQILQETPEPITIESAPDDIKYSIINSLLYVNIAKGQTLEQFITYSLNIFPNFLIYPSVMLLSLIICLIQLSYKELSLLLIKICQKLIATKSYLLIIKHEGFENDLLYLEFILTYKNFYIPNNNMMILKEASNIETNFQLQMQLLLFHVYNSTSNFKNIEIIQNILELLPENQQNLKSLKILCELLFWIYNNLIDPMDLEFPEKLLTQSYDSSLYELIIKHQITRYYLITKRYSHIEKVSQRVVDLFYQMTYRETIIQQSQLQKNETTFLFEFFQLNSQFQIQYNVFDLQYYFLLNQYFRNEVLLNYIEIQMFLNLDKVKILYFFKLFTDLHEDMLLSQYFKLLSQLLYEYSLNIYMLEQQLEDSSLRVIVSKLSEIASSLKKKQKQLSLNHADYDLQIKTNRQIKLITFIISIYNSLKSKIDKEKLVDYSLQSAKLQKRFLINYQLTLEENYDTKADIILQIHNADHQLLLCQCYLQMNDLENASICINEAEVLYSMMTRQDPSYSYFQIELTKYRIFYFQFMVSALYNLWKQIHKFKYCHLKILVQKILYYNAEIIILFQSYNKCDHKLLVVKILTYIESDPNSHVNEIDYSDFKTYYLQAIDSIMLEVYTTFSRSMYVAEQYGISHSQKNRLSVLMQDLKSFLQSLIFLN